MPEGQIQQRAPLNRFDRDPERSYGLPARYYIDPAVYEREKEAIFYRSWNLAGHMSQLREAGSYITCQVADQNLFVVRGKDEKLRAFYNVCSHRAHELLRGSGCAKVIICPYHAWSYHADGRLRTARGSEKVAGFNPGEFGLKPVQVEEMAGFVFVNLDPQAATLASQAPELEPEIRRYEPAVDRLVFRRRISWHVKANWKNAVDNFLECYHCTPAHPAFADLVDVKRYRTRTYGLHSSHIGPPGRSDNSAYPIPPGQESDFAGWWLWPSATFNTLPGPGNLTVFQMVPTGPETTLEHFDFYFAEDGDEACQAAAIEYVDKVLQPEDIGLIESVQRGLHSRGYHQGRFMVDKERTYISEHGLHHFHGLVLQALGELPG